MSQSTTPKDLVVAMADMAIMELPESSLDFDGFWEPLLLLVSVRRCAC
jgi:hypothetical protein